ncbi:MAG: hypothetical protein DRP97_05910 [Candidatus Latescibacterota bacterium]|nr:MAG: hypothetical protein DRP97_05910 [Candidatus Latescibacterota bacterium]
MIITKETVAGKICETLRHAMSPANLVDWAEEALRDAAIDEKDADLIAELLARLGLGDVKQFGLMWEDCFEFLRRLGYEVEIKAKRRAAA